MLPCFFCGCFISCNNNGSKKESRFSANHNSLDNKEVDTTYMYTGYYFLSETQDGIKMKKYNSDEIYKLSKTPFASVNNISKVQLLQNKLDGKIYNDLCFDFDISGTKDLKEGTVNALHPQIAIVIANKLLYVVDNNVKSETGKMCISLIGFTRGK